MAGTSKKSPAQKNVLQKNRLQKNTPERASLLAAATSVVMPLLVLLWCVGYYVLGGEIVAVNQGYGWDGFFYGSAAWGFDKLLDQPVLDSYRAQRVGPSAVIHYVMRGLGIALNQDTILRAFIVWNTALLSMGALLWSFAARRLALVPTAQWLGFIGLFCSFFVMKSSVYYPPLTDVSAFVLGLAAVYLYVARKDWWLLGVAAFGYFTFPTMFVIAMLLFVLPPANGESSEQPHEPVAPSSPVQIALTSVVVLLAAAAMVYCVLIAKIEFKGTDPIFQPTLYPSMALVLAYMGFATWQMLSGFSMERLQVVLKLIASLRFVVRFATSAALAALLTVARARLQSPDPRVVAPTDVGLFLGGSLSMAVAKPLLAVVANAVYFGPIILLAVLFYRHAAHAAWRIGTGFAVVFFVAALMSGIMTESRQFVNLLPVVVTALVVALNDRTVNDRTIKDHALKAASVAVVGVMAVFGSKAWMTLNVPMMDKKAFDGDFMNSPFQKYFMNHGPWMSMESYLLQGSLMLACGCVLWWLFVRGASSSALNPSTQNQTTKTKA